MAAKHILTELGTVTLVSLSETLFARALSFDGFATPRLATLLLANILLWYSYKCIVYPLYFHPFRKLPRPKVSLACDLQVQHLTLVSVLSLSIRAQQCRVHQPARPTVP